MIASKSAYAAALVDLWGLELFRQVGCKKRRRSLAVYTSRSWQGPAFMEVSDGRQCIYEDHYGPSPMKPVFHFQIKYVDPSVNVSPRESYHNVGSG